MVYSGHIRTPTEEEIRKIAAEFHMRLKEEEVAAIRDSLDELLSEYHRIDELYDSVGHEISERSVYKVQSDPYNAFTARCSIQGSDDGLLSGLDVGLKDNISVAGIEMRCGTRALSGYVPERDATVVSRLLSEGANIVGKLNMENMAKSGSGDFSDGGPVFNPRNPDYLAGGSSSGSGAAVASGDVDVAIGTDQGGSIRIPSAWCGCVGHKPTHGLVPYTGIVGIGHTFDHVGPMAMTVENCAKTLEAIAGNDGRDPRQDTVKGNRYSKKLDRDPSELRIGVLNEGFGLPETEEGIDDTVRRGLTEFEDAGASLHDRSVPLHTDGSLLWVAINYSAVTALVRDEGVGHFVEGYYDTSFQEAFAKARRTNANDFSLPFKQSIIAGSYLAEEYHQRFHARAQNIRFDLGDSYDEALDDLDVLALPTVPKTPPRHKPNLPLDEALDRATDMAANTAPFDITGHPAVSVPVGAVNGLPVGLMFVGRKNEDETLLQVAKAFEELVGCESLNWGGAETAS